MNNFLIGTVVAGTAAGFALDITRKMGWKISPCIDKLQQKEVGGYKVHFILEGALLGLTTGVVADSGVMNVVGSILTYHPKCAGIALLPVAFYFARDKIPG